MRLGKGFFIKLIIVFVLLGIAGGVIYYIRKNYRVENVYVNGNVHYTQEEVKNFVLDGSFLSDNSLYLSVKYKDKEITDIPFVDVLSVDVLSPDTIRINVIEKSIVGYILSMDSCMYFDKDGYIVESSDEKAGGIPRVTGLPTEHLVLGERLDVDDYTIFDRINTITKTLDKDGLKADNIYFRPNGDVTIYFARVKVNLGELDEYLEDKISALPEILESLNGLKGTLYMEDYDENEGKYIFKEE